MVDSVKKIRRWGRSVALVYTTSRHDDRIDMIRSTDFFFLFIYPQLQCILFYVILSYYLPTWAALLINSIFMIGFTFAALASGVIRFSFDGE